MVSRIIPDHPPRGRQIEKLSVKQSRSKTSDQDKHTSIIEPQDLATMITALVRSTLSDLGVTKDLPPKESLSRESPLWSHTLREKSVSSEIHHCWISAVRSSTVGLTCTFSRRKTRNF